MPSLSKSAFFNASSTMHIEVLLQEAQECLFGSMPKNSLLNFCPSTQRTIQITEEDLAGFFEMLVVRKKVMQFWHSFSNQSDSEEASYLATIDFPENETQEMEGLPVLQNAGGYLQRDLTEEVLQARLNKIYQRTNRAFGEYGASFLYLTLGCLEWRENQRSPLNCAPLILIPVSLKRSEGHSQFRLRWSGGQVFSNLALEVKFRALGIELPKFKVPENKMEIEAYFLEIAKVARGKKGGNIVPHIDLNLDVSHNSFLSFFTPDEITPFIVYKDVESVLKQAELPPLIRKILSPTQRSLVPPDFIQLQDRPRLVLDADSSQIEVIKTAKKGSDIIVCAPPGTGKCQTIVNIIAEFLADKKKVLFVSGRKQVLEKVNRQFENVGFGDFCLELYGNKADVGEVLNDLEQNPSLPPSSAFILKEYNSLSHQINSLEGDLKAYINSLHEPIGEMSRSPFALLSVREKARRHFGSKKYKMPEIKFTNLSECKHPVNWSESERCLKELAQTLKAVTPIDEHPWRGCVLDITIRDEYDLNVQIEECRGALDALKGVLHCLVNTCGIRPPDSLKDLPNVLTAVKVMERSFPVERNVLENTEWDRAPEKAKILIQKVENFRKVQVSAREKFTEETLKKKKKDIVSFLEEKTVESEIQKLYKLYHPSYKQWRTAHLEMLIAYISLCRKLQREETGTSFFGKHWQGEKSEVHLLREFSEWIICFRKQLRTGNLEKQAVEIASKVISKEQIKDLLRCLESTVNNFRAKRDKLFFTLGTNTNTLFGVTAEEVSFKRLHARLKVWSESLDVLRDWQLFVKSREECEKTVAKPLLSCLKDLAPDDLIYCFQGNLADALLQEVLAKRPSLQNFDSNVHEKKIEEFCKLESDWRNLNKERLLTQLSKRLSTFNPRDKNSQRQVGILQTQFNQSDERLSIQDLLLNAGELIQEIKPCFMMQAESVALFCPRGEITFDVVVFDEANQIRPEYALGALSRSKQAVLIGDAKQLPPPDFLNESQNRDEKVALDVSIWEVGSILDQCRRCEFEEKMLKWHYQSRHESLITFSNQMFYNSALLVFPSSFAEAEHLGLKFIDLQNTVCEKQDIVPNQNEAKVVVQAVLDSYLQYPDKSLGIGTLDPSQQKAIFDEINSRLSQDPSMAKYFTPTCNEDLFVESLEKIQANERDVIFLSLGREFDEKGKLVPQLGCLSNPGSEYFLNVFITRAREQCVVFSSFRSRVLQNTDAAAGEKFLKYFLDYAENRNLQISKQAAGNTNSPFESAIHEFLTSLGYVVRTQIGYADYRIDLAVVDPDEPERYLLGIKCDGRQYRNLPSVQDQYSLAPAMLERLGWVLHRVWAIGWYKDPEGEKNRLKQKLEEARFQKVS